MYKTIELFGEKVDIKHSHCARIGETNKPCDMKINLYIKVTDMCNGKCSVCSNHGNEKQSEIDYDKLIYVIKYLDSRNLINRISITGGEPFLDFDRLNKTLNAIYEAKEDAFVTINTNGFRIKECMNLDQINRVEGIHISRHHYEDDINNKFFGVKVASKDDIYKVLSASHNKQLIRLNCLLMKSYINNIQEVQRYLEMAGELGVFRCGFVSLMPINEESIREFINFNDIFKTLPNDMVKTDALHDHEICECMNGAYIAKNGNLVEYYARMTKELNCPYTRQFVYTSDNHLSVGFNKKPLI